MTYRMLVDDDYVGYSVIHAVDISYILLVILVDKESVNNKHLLPSINHCCFKGLFLENRLFSYDDLALLQAPHAWCLISSYCGSDVRSGRHARYARWAGAHRHRHIDPELNFILRGEGHQSIDGRVYVARPGTLFIQDGNFPHEVRYPPWCPPSERLNIYFIRERMVIRLVETGVGRRNYRERWNFIMPVSELGFQSPRNLFASHLSVPPALIRFRNLASASFLISCAIGWGFRSTSVTADFNAEVITQIENHIHRTIGKGCSLDVLADMAGYSRFHFLRLFRRHTGMSLREYIDRVRLEALTAMRAANVRTNAMSEAMGFTHPSSFIRWRKRHMHQSQPAFAKPTA